MADYIETVPQEKFNMRLFRTDGDKGRECNSVGCVIGHCTILDENPLPMFRSGDINFTAWLREFTGLGPLSGESAYLFASSWEAVDNTPTGAAKRIRHFLEHGLPQDWRMQMAGYAPLSYMS